MAAPKFGSYIVDVHDLKKPFKCASCYFEFWSKEDLKDHIFSVHNGEIPFHCNACDAKFSQQENLETHINSIHEGKSSKLFKEVEKVDEKAVRKRSYEDSSLNYSQLTQDGKKTTKIQGMLI